MVVYLALFGLIILIAAAAVVLGSPAVEEGTPSEKKPDRTGDSGKIGKRR